MKHWAILTVFLYALALIVLTVPVILLAFGGWGLKHDSKSLRETLDIYSVWAYWVWLAVLVGGQALLLLLPLRLAERRLPARRPLKLPIIVTAFFLANLCFAGLFSLLCAIFTDNAFEYFNLARLFHFGADQNGQNHDSGNAIVYTMLFTVLVFWMIWALVFFRNFGRTDAPEALRQRLTRWLLRGSILELLIAVPSHVVVRRRDDCCAPIGSFWGIVTGLSVMLLCFGPGVFFLFVERWHKLQPKPADPGKPL